MGIQTIGNMTSFSTTEVPNIKFNYIVELQKLVAQILVEMGRISSNDHETIEQMKRRFFTSTFQSADIQTEQGRLQRNMGLLVFAVFCARLGLPNADDKAITEVISQQIPQFLGLFSSTKQADLMRTQAEASLELEKYRSKTASKQTDGGAKQDYIALLQSIGESLKSASRANG